MTPLEEEIEDLKSLIKETEKRIDFLIGYEDLGCDGTGEELKSCRGWLRTYKNQLEDAENESRGKVDNRGIPPEGGASGSVAS